VPRRLLALTVSLAVHVAPWIWGQVSFFGNIEMPEIDLEFTEVELLDPDTIQGEAPEEEPEPAVVEPPPVDEPTVDEEGEGDAAEDESEEEPEEEKEPPRNLGERKSDIDKLGPESSTFFVMLVPRRIRKLSFREKAMDVMAPLPDFDYLITKGGFDPLRDFDHIVLASTDLRDWRQTFLAVDSPLGRSEIQRGIERAAAESGERVEWIEEKGIIRGNPTPIDPETPDVDERWFVLLDNGISVYVLPTFLPYVMGDKQIGDEKTSGNFVGNLTRLKRFAARQPTAGLHFVATDIRRSIKRTNLPFELPNRFELLAEAESSPELSILFGFETAVDAKAFEQFWTGPVAKAIDDNVAMRWTVKPFYEMLELTRDGKEVRLWARFSQEQTEKILELIADFVVRGLKKSPEEMKKAREQRIERWNARKGGKLPPSALDPKADEEPSGSARDQPAQPSPEPPDPV
jgi:hypothetical protein